MDPGRGRPDLLETSVRLEELMEVKRVRKREKLAIKNKKISHSYSAKYF